MSSNKSKMVMFAALFVLMFAFGMVKVNAKEVTISCNYHAPKFSLADFDGADIECKVYSDYSHACWVKYNGNSNREDILNWSSGAGTNFIAKDYTKENKKCPDLLLVKIKSGFLVIDGYKVYAAENEAMLKTMQTTLNANTSDWHSAYITGYKFDEAKVEAYYKTVKDDTTYIENTYKSYNKEECMKNSDSGDKTSECRSTIQKLNSSINSSEIEVNGLVKSGYIEEDNSVTKEYRKVVSDARTALKTAEYEIALIDCQANLKAGLVKSCDNITPPQNGGNTSNGTINNEPINCEDFKYGANSIIDELFTLIMIIGPILVIVLSSVDFAKASLASDESAVKKSGNRFGKRLIAAALLFILPLIINFILGIATDAGIFTEIPDTCVDQNY